MIVLAFTSEEAARIVNGEQTVMTFSADEIAMLGMLSDRFPDYMDTLVGQTVAIARLPVKPAEERDEDTATAWQHLARWHGTGNPNDLLPDQRAWLEAVTSEGAIVGSARVADVVPHQHDYTPDFWQVILTDAAPCEERCVLCGGAMNEQTPRGRAGCDSDGTPIPCEVTGPIMEWTP